MLPKVFTILYPPTYSEFESIKAAGLFVISLRFYRGIAILCHLIAPPFFKLLVVLDDNVLGVELSERVLEFRIIGEVTEQLDRRTLSTIATEEYCSYIRTDIPTKFSATPFHHQVIFQEMLYEESHIRILGVVDQIETV